MPERPNRYKAACRQAASTARRAVDVLATPGGRPLAGTLTTLQQAWASPSRQRQDYQTTLDDLSHRLTRAFMDTAADLADMAAAEPDTVDTDDPRHAWKPWVQRPKHRPPAPHLTPPHLPTEPPPGRCGTLHGVRRSVWLGRV